VADAPSRARVARAEQLEVLLFAQKPDI